MVDILTVPAGGHRVLDKGTPSPTLAQEMRQRIVVIDEDISSRRTGLVGAEEWLEDSRRRLEAMIRLRAEYAMALMALGDGG